jgi:hypothetical protein
MLGTLLLVSFMGTLLLYMILNVRGIAVGSTVAKEATDILGLRTSRC